MNQFELKLPVEGLEQKGPTVISLFSGAGGMDIGFLNAGFQIIWANDIDKDACNSYKINIGDHITLASINNIDLSLIPDADVVIGGPPCQGFSVAGKMDLSDPRSQLIWSFYTVVKTKMPKVFVMENVAALARLDKFKKIRNELFKRYYELGYYIEYKVLNSKDYGVAQKRERMILIGTRLPYAIQFPDANKNIVSTRDILSNLPAQGIGINTGICNAKITIAQNPIYRKSPYAGMLFNGLGRPINLDEPAQTLPASMGGNKTPIIETNLLHDITSTSWVKEHHKLVESKTYFDAYSIEVPEYIRRITVREAARIQSFPDSYEFSGSQSQQYKQIGNAVPPLFAYHIAQSVRNSMEFPTERKATDNFIPLLF